jgi:hypothetical protein
MTSKLRTLALLSACALWGACEQPSAAEKPPATKSLVQSEPTKKTIKPEPVKLDTAPLTATAPERPRSILDTPLSAQPDPLAKPETAVVLPEEKPTTDGEQKPDLDEKLSVSDVHIDRFVLAKDVAGREPVEETDTFSTDTDKIFAFVQFANAEGAPFSLRVTWEEADGPASPYGYVMEVPTAARFRTWSWTRIKRSPGQYRAVLRTLEGEEVASRTFVIEGDQL